MITAKKIILITCFVLVKTTNAFADETLKVIKTTPTFVQYLQCQNIKLTNKELCEFLSYRMEGIEYYLPPLEAFFDLNDQEQKHILTTYFSGDLKNTNNKLIQDLRLPVPLLKNVLFEARKNGADEDWDMPAFLEILQDLRLSGDAPSQTFDDLAEFSPINTHMIALMVESDHLDAEGERLDAEGERLDAEGERLDAEGERLDAEIERLNAEIKALEAANQVGRKVIQALGNMPSE